MIENTHKLFFRLNEIQKILISIHTLLKILIYYIFGREYSKSKWKTFTTLIPRDGNNSEDECWNNQSQHNPQHNRCREVEIVIRVVANRSGDFNILYKVIQLLNGYVHKFYITV